MTEEVRKTRTPTEALEMVAELNRTCAVLRKAYLESRRPELEELFAGYLEGPIEKPDHDAALLGFRDAWLRGDLETIVAVGKKLSRKFLETHREAGAIYFVAANRLRERAGQ